MASRQSRSVKKKDEQAEETHQAATSSSESAEKDAEVKKEAMRAARSRSRTKTRRAVAPVISGKRFKSRAGSRGKKGGGHKERDELRKMKKKEKEAVKREDGDEDEDDDDEEEEEDASETCSVPLELEEEDGESETCSVPLDPEEEDERKLVALEPELKATRGGGSPKKSRKPPKTYQAHLVRSSSQRALAEAEGRIVKKKSPVAIRNRRTQRAEGMPVVRVPRARSTKGKAKQEAKEFGGEAEAVAVENGASETDDEDDDDDDPCSLPLEPEGDERRGGARPTSTVLVHFREKLVAAVDRKGDIKHAQICGSVTTSECETVALRMRNNSDAAEGMLINLELHPNIDKAAWAGSSILRLKSANKPFPVQNDVGVLKWRATIQDEEALPITLNVQPKETPDGCQVYIEYTLHRTEMTLNDVVITVPLPTSTTPVVAEYEGNYKYQKAKNQLVWTVPVIDASNSTGALEFVIAKRGEDEFFPISIRFSSMDTLVDIEVEEVLLRDGSEEVTHSTTKELVVGSYMLI